MRHPLHHCMPLTLRRKEMHAVSATGELQTTSRDTDDED